MTRFILALGLLLVIVGHAINGQTASERTASLAAGLRAESQEAKTKAILGVLAMKPADRTPAIRSALIAELSRIVSENRVRGARMNAGETLEPVEDHGLYMRRVIEALSQDTDPSIIGPLCEVIDTGGLARNGLAKFGQAAVPPVKRIAVTETEPRRVASAFRVLEQMVTSHQLDAGTRNEIAAVAASRLSGRQHPIIIGAAAGLGVSMKDAAALSRVRALLEDDAEIRAMGISDPGDLAWLRKKLERLLAQK